MFILSFRRAKREFGDGHLVGRDALFWSVWCPALGEIVERWSPAVSGPDENEPLVVEDEGAVLRRNFGSNSPNGTASRSRRSELWAAPM